MLVIQNMSIFRRVLNSILCWAFALRLIREFLSTRAWILIILRFSVFQKASNSIWTYWTVWVLLMSNTIPVKQVAWHKLINTLDWRLIINYKKIKPNSPIGWEVCNWNKIYSKIGRDQLSQFLTVPNKNVLFIMRNIKIRNNRNLSC